MTTNSEEVSGNLRPSPSLSIEGAGLITPVVELLSDGVSDGMAVVSYVEDVAGAFAVLLAGADVDHWTTEKCTLPDSRAGITNKRSGTPQDGQELLRWQMSQKTKAVGYGVVLSMFPYPLRECVGAGVLSRPQPHDGPQGELV